MRHRFLIRQSPFWLCCVLALFCSRPLRADGGVMQFRAQAGRFLVTLFSTPSPLEAGPADLSVLVELASDRRTLLDAQVTLHLHPHGADSSKIVHVSATRARANNKLLYAAMPNLSQPGVWDVQVDIQEARLHGSAQGSIQVLPPPPALLADWPYFALVPLLIFLFVLNQYLRRKQLAIFRDKRTRHQ